MLNQILSNNYDVVKSAQEASSSPPYDDFSALFWIVIVITGADFILSIIKFAFDWTIKNRDKHINSHNIKEAKRINHLEVIYRELNKMVDDVDLQKVRKMQSYVSENRIYVSKEFRKIINASLDYHIGVLGNPRTTDIQKPLQLLESYCKLFEKK
jgi:hypothetical protein